MDKRFSIFIIVILITTLPSYQFYTVNDDHPYKTVLSRTLSKETTEPEDIQPISIRSSEWMLNSYSEFINGTLDNVTVEGSGDQAHLVIDFPIKKGWEQKYPNGSPKFQSQYVLAQIYGTDNVLLYGGLDLNFYYDNTSWLYNLSKDNWSKISPINDVPYRLWPSISSIYGDDKVMLFGGNVGTKLYVNDTWIYDLSDNDWVQSTSTYRPSERENAGLAAVYGSDCVVLFGGMTAWGLNNETWIYNVTTDNWTAVSPKHSPPMRTSGCLSTIYGTDKVLLCGGYDGVLNYFSDTWIYDLSDNKWTEKISKLSLPIANKIYAATAPIEGTDKILMATLGNESHTSLFTTETWVYDLSENNWTNEQFKTKPCYSESYALAPIHRTDKVLLFTGYHNVSSNTTWVYTYNTVYTNGTYISPPHKFDQNTTYTDLSWNAEIPKNTSVKFQIRTELSKSALLNSSFRGPNGDIFSFYETPPHPIWPGLCDQPWLQVIVYLNTTVAATPKVWNLTVSFNHWPLAELISPENGSITSNTKPTFTWNFTDPDTSEQRAFQLLIDDDINFESIDFNSKVVFSNKGSWKINKGNGYSKLPDGTWYWKVCVQDNEGAWGFYSKPWKLVINTRPPKSNISFPLNNRIYKEMITIYGNATKSPNGTAVAYVMLAVQRVSDGLYWDGFDYRREEMFWLLANGTNNWSFNTSMFTWRSGERYRLYSRAADFSNNIEHPGLRCEFLMDLEPVVFYQQWPAEDTIFNSTKLNVGITVSDKVSGVDISTIMYAVSYDSGHNWTSWEAVPGITGGKDKTTSVESIGLILNLTFQNGTGNRIKYRASDAIGHGPTESRPFMIMIDTREKLKNIPGLILLSPSNGSVIPATQVRLSWGLEPINSPIEFTQVNFDIYFDTMDPPKKMVKQNETNTSLLIDELENERTYYWTVTPKFDGFTGRCLSGIWSFHIDAPVPKVNLTSPLNGSVIYTSMPELVWSLIYNGSDKISYDLYFGTTQIPKLKYEKLTNTNYSIDENESLIENTTYYWQVVPWFGNNRGVGSEIWLFSFKITNSTPFFGLRLTLEPTNVELKPDQYRSVAAKVENLGSKSDIISLEFLVQPNRGVGMVNNGPSNLSVLPGATDQFNLTVLTANTVREGVVYILVFASSQNAKELNSTVRDERLLTINIKIPDYNKDQDVDNGPDILTGFYTSVSQVIIFIILMIIIAIILILAILVNRKRKDKKKDIDKSKSTSSQEKAVITPKPELKSKTEPLSKPESKTITKPIPTSVPIPIPKPVSKPITKPVPKPIPKPEPKPMSKPASEPVTKSTMISSKPTAEAASDIKTDAKQT